MQTKDDDFDFGEWLKEFGRGATNKIAGDRLREIVAACETTGRKGSLSIKIEISAAAGLAEVRASVTCKKPEPALPGGAFYTDKEGNLLDEDPRQTSLPAKILDVPPVRVMHVHHTEPSTPSKE